MTVKCPIHYRIGLTDWSVLTYPPTDQLMNGNGRQVVDRSGSGCEFASLTTEPTTRPRPIRAIFVMCVNCQDLSDDFRQQLYSSTSVCSVSESESEFQMSFEDNKSFWEEFILLYQENPCLWDIKSKDYRNKQKKNAAYENLIDKCKELFPNANKEFVIKKISSLRASFRRQIRRINSSKRSGIGTEDVSETTLWYFDLLSFLMDQEESRSAVSSLEENNLDDQSQASETDSYTQHSGQHLDLPPVLSPETSQSSTSNSRHKRTQNSATWTKKKLQFLDASLKILEKEDTTQQNVTEPQEITFGKNIGQQLQEIEARQKVVAQKLISDVLFHAKLGNLTDSSLISLSYQPAPYPITPCIPQAQVFQQSYTNFPTSMQSTCNEPSRSYTRQPEVSTPQTFTTLTTTNQASRNRDVMEEFLCFQKRINQ